MTASLAHLTADELDGLHDGLQTARITSHLATCADCRAMVTHDRLVLAALASLTQPGPGVGFADRVMAQVQVGRVAPAAAPSAVPAITPRSVSARRRVLVAGGLTGAAVAGGFAWAALNPADALGLASPAWQQAGETLWTGVQAGVANLVEQPWFVPLRDMLATPVRAVPILLGAAGAYALALLGMRRLLTGPAPHAGW